MIEESEPYLDAETPSPNVDRVVGLLDSFTISTRTCVLKLADGTSLRGNVGANVDLDQLKLLLGLDVLVEGTIAFRSSGQPLRVQIDYVAAATTQDQLWQRTAGEDLVGEQPVIPGDELGGLFGQWPGDETDEQVFAALRELS